MDATNGANAPSMPQRKPVPQAQPPASWDTVPHTFFAGTLLAATAFSWPLRWVISGAPILFYCILLGESHSHRILASFPLWAIFPTLNLIYIISATSWLLYWVFAAFCYPAIIVTCILQFEYAARLARQAARKLIFDLHFINDKVAFFNLPALEIDTNVNGLMVIRGITFSLSTFTAEVHGVEVGLKMSEDIELAIQTNKVTISLLRKIEVDDVYANIKGGDWEMTFASLKADEAHEEEDESFVVTDTPILRAASIALDGTYSSPVRSRMEMADGAIPEDAPDTKAAFDSVTQLSPNEDTAKKQYTAKIREISETSTINMAIKALKGSSKGDGQEGHLDFDKETDLRAAACAHIHEQTSIPHPPSKSIRVSTFKKTSFPNFKLFLHRLPLLYRLLLNPICFFHPVTFKSITAAGSGKWFKYLMKQYFFKHYATSDPDVRRLESRISAWLADANFAVEMGEIKSTAQVPINPIYDIECHFKIADIMAYRTLPGAVDLTQVVRVAGADAIITLPSYLLPRHEHLLPPEPTAEEEEKLEEQIDEMKDSPHEVRARTKLEQLRKDEANMNISAHAHLPARFNQELLNFVAALVKASKVIETDKDFEEIKSLRELKRAGMNVSTASNLSTAPGAGTDALSPSSDSDNLSIRSDTTGDLNPEKKSLKNWMRKADTGFKEAGTIMRDGMRKAGLSTASAMANDRWIAKLVGKIVQKLERAQGDVGYSGNIPIPLQPYRERGEPYSKLLP